MDFAFTLLQLGNGIFIGLVTPLLANKKDVVI